MKQEVLESDMEREVSEIVAHIRAFAEAWKRTCRGRNKSLRRIAHPA